MVLDLVYWFLLGTIFIAGLAVGAVSLVLAMDYIDSDWPQWRKAATWGSRLFWFAMFATFFGYIVAAAGGAA